MSRQRTTTRFVPIYGVPSWRLPDRGASWWIGDDRPRSAAVLELAASPADLAPVPIGPRPKPLEPIDGAPVIRGLAVPFGQWTEIRSRAEGHFFEKFSRGSFARDLANPSVRLGALFQHGQDPSMGMRSLGPVQAWESERGLEFELACLPTRDALDIATGVRAGAYGGASIRFSTARDSIRRNPPRSATNPRGIEERDIKEARLREISIVLWPAYAGTSVQAA